MKQQVNIKKLDDRAVSRLMELLFQPERICMPVWMVR